MKIDDIQKELKNDRKADDLLRLLKTNSTVPTHTPKKFVDCFWLYNVTTTYRLYVYIDNSWKYVSLS